MELPVIGYAQFRLDVKCRSKLRMGERIVTSEIRKCLPHDQVYFRQLNGIMPGT